MKSEYQINMDFQKAEAQVSELRSLANQMRDIANEELNRTLNNINANWDGENSEAFLAKGRMLKSRISNTATDIDRIADSIHAIAENTKRAELEAVRIAREKEYLAQKQRDQAAREAEAKRAEEAAAAEAARRVVQDASNAIRGIFTPRGGGGFR